jgi:hypothetical protein
MDRIMIEEKKRTLAYFCPECRQPVIAELSAFSLAAASTEIPCPCGKSKLKIEPVGDHVKVTVPCVFCGHDHTAACSMDAFFHQKALAFSCHASGLDCCYVGEEDLVFRSTRRLEEAVDKLDSERGERGAFLNEVIMQEVLSELKGIAQRGGVTCSCGCKEWKLKVGYSAVHLTCAQCGGTLRVPAATADDLDDICCKDGLLIHGRKG